MGNEAVVRSISRAIRILQAINLGGALSLTEISRAANLPYPTAGRILHTLMQEGLVETEKTRKYYRVTRLVQSLSFGFKETSLLGQIAHPHMSSLTKRISWPVSIATRVGKSMQVRDSTHIESALTLCNYEYGYTVPVLGSASGRVYLAHAPDEERIAVLKGIELTDGKSSDLTMFESERTIMGIRKDGYAVYLRNPYNPIPGKTSSISVPIFTPERIIAALTMTYFASAMPINTAIRTFLDDMTATARDIGLALSDASQNDNGLV